MDIEIQESKFSRFFRIYYKILTIYFYVGGMFFFMLSIIFLIKKIIFTFIVTFLFGLPLLILGYILHSGVSRISIVKNDSIVLIRGKTEIVINYKDIIYIFKFFRYPLIKKYPMLLVANVNESKIRFIIINEPEYNFTDIFKNKGIKLINFP